MFLDLVEVLEYVLVLFGGEFDGYAHQYQRSQSRIMCVREVVDKCVQRISSLDVIIDACNPCQPNHG